MRRRTPEPKPSSTPSVSFVDDALRVAAGREHFTRAEAMRLLHQVEASTHDLPMGTRVVEIVNRVDVGSRDQLVLARADVVNPLLDIRLALAR